MGHIECQDFIYTGSALLDISENQSDFTLAFQFYSFTEFCYKFTEYVCARQELIPCQLFWYLKNEVGLLSFSFHKFLKQITPYVVYLVKCYDRVGLKCLMSDSLITSCIRIDLNDMNNYQPHDISDNCAHHSNQFLCMMWSVNHTSSILNQLYRNISRLLIIILTIAHSKRTEFKK